MPPKPTVASLQARLAKAEHRLERMTQELSARLDQLTANPARVREALDAMRPVDDGLRSPDAELAELVGSQPRSTQALVAELRACDLEELRDDAVADLPQDGALWRCLCVLNEAGVIFEEDVLAALVRNFSSAARRTRPTRA